jgi:hypothetical protein
MDSGADPGALLADPRDHLHRDSEASKDST